MELQFLVNFSVEQSMRYTEKVSLHILSKMLHSLRLKIELGAV